MFWKTCELNHEDVFALRLPFLGGLFGWLLLDLALKHWLTRLRWKASDHFETISAWRSDTLHSTSIVFMKIYSRISQWWVHFYSCYVWWNGKHGSIVTRQPLQPLFFQTLNEGFCRAATLDRLIFFEVAIFIARRWSYLGIFEMRKPNSGKSRICLYGVIKDICCFFCSYAMLYDTVFIYIVYHAIEDTVILILDTIYILNYIILLYYCIVIDISISHLLVIIIVTGW